MGILTPLKSVVELSGSTVSIGGTDFRLMDGNTIYGVFADRPTASNTATAVGQGAVYFATDTQAAYMVSGSSWVAM